MKLRFGLTIVASGMVVLGSLGMGHASANNEYAGQTYAEASGRISGGGGTVVIASVVGSQVQTDDCIVMSSRKSSNLDSSGRSRGYQIQLDLNCNQALAQPGKPGNSLASETGSEAKKVLSWIETWNKGNVNSCIKNAESAKWCLGQCEKYGGCSADTLQAFSSNS